MRWNELAVAVVSVSAILGQGPPELVVQDTGSDTVHTVAFGGGGKWIAGAVAGQEASLRIYDTASGRLLHNLAAAGVGVDFATDPVGNRIAVISGGVGIVYDVEAGAELWRYSTPVVKNQTPACTFLFSADGKQIHALTIVTPRALFRMPKPEITYRLFDAISGRELQSKPLAIDGIGATLSDDARWVVARRMRLRRGFSTSSQVYDLATGRPVGSELPGMIMASHAGAQRALVMGISEKGSGGMQLIDVATGKSIPLPGNDPALRGAFSPDGRKIALSVMGKGWQIVDVTSGASIFAGSSSLPMAMGGVSFTAAGDRFVTGQYTPIVVETANPMNYRIIGKPEALLLTSERAAQLMNEPQLQKRDADAMKEERKLFRHLSDVIPSATVTADGRWLVARATDNQLGFWDAATGNRLPFRVASTLESKQPLQNSSNSRYLLLQSESEKTTYTVQTKVGRKMIESEVEGQGFSTVRVDLRDASAGSPQEFPNVHCASAGREYVVTLSNTGKGEVVASLRSTTDGSTVAELTQLGLDLGQGCSVSPDGTRIVVTKVESKPVQWKAYPLYMSAMYREGVLGKESGLVIYDVKSRLMIAELLDSEKGKPGKFPFSPDLVQWSPDGRFLVGGGGGYASFKHGPIRVWEAASGREISVFAGTGSKSVVGISPDGAHLIVSEATPTQPLRANAMPWSQSFGIEVLDLRTGRPLYSLPNASSWPNAVVFHPNGRVILAPDRDHAVSIYRRSDGELLGQFRPMQEGEWLASSPAGIFDGSPRGWSLVSWRGAGQTSESASGEIFFNEFYRPGLLSDLLEGRRSEPARAISEIDRRQPKITIEASPAGTRLAKVRIEAAEAPAAGQAKGSGVRDLRLFRNGLLLKAWRGDLSLNATGSVAVEATVPAVAGENRFVAYAFNAQNIKSSDATAIVKNDNPARQSVAYVLAIGINEYANSDFNLKYATADAEALAAQFAARQKALQQFSSVRTIPLFNKEATRDNIRLALDLLTGARSGALPREAPASLAGVGRVQPEDAVIIFFAGHGAAAGDRFYLIPHDLGYLGPRKDLKPNLAKLLQSGISDQDLERALEPMDARHIVLIIDACQSGQALSSDDDRRGPMNSRGLAQLAWEKGMSILAASQGYQAALESEKLGHGYLTFALVEEALKTTVADATPKDGAITSTEWLEYPTHRVPRLQIEALEQAREAKRSLTFESEPNSTGQARLQTPRFFTRREPPDAPLIVLKQ